MREMLLDEVRRSVKTAYPDVSPELLERLSLELPRDPSHGDFATNAAFLLKDVAHDNPRKIAERLVGTMAGGISDAEVAGPGFINFRIRPEGIAEFLKKIADAGERKALLADPDLARETGRIQIEFVSANPTGPMNVVSARAAAFGDACVRLLRATGCDAAAEYYVNDEGNQARLFGKSLEARFLQAAGHDAELPEDGYRGEYVTELGRTLHGAVAALAAAGKSVGAAFQSGKTIAEIAAEAGDPPPGPAPVAAVGSACASIDFARLGLDSMVAAAQEALRGYGVEYDVVFRESSLHRAPDGGGKSRVDEAEALLRERGHVREEDGALWFTATEFGDDKDRVIRRSEGQPTYLLGDVAYHLDKVRRGFDHVVDVWGPDHHGYIKRLHSATVALGQPEDWLKILLVQQVNLLRDGEAVKMSKRDGELVTLDELVEEVGKDVARFLFLVRRASTHLDFDLELAKKQSMDNPVYYVQYAHARCRSIFRQPMAQEVLDAEPEADLSLLTAEEETAMMRTLLQYPQTVKEAARALEPHRLVAFLREVAGTYHRFYTRGRNDASFRVLSEDRKAARARLFLVGALADVLREGLDLLGIEAVDHM
ncbi:MAG TPA: arginine--tRNA ligase [bacterium]|nr:arginine--tRNA ligase [bacterium]